MFLANFRTNLCWRKKYWSKKKLNRNCSARLIGQLTWRIWRAKYLIQRRLKRSLSIIEKYKNLIALAILICYQFSLYDFDLVEYFTWEM